MSEQKMPALPINDDTGMYYCLGCWNRATVERIQREAYEACRQHERERRVADGAGEPVAWLTDSGGLYRNKGVAFACGAQSVEPLYTTPPSADALVEALRKLSAEWRAVVEQTKPSCEVARTVDYLADELDALIAKHKENSR